MCAAARRWGGDARTGTQISARTAARWRRAHRIGASPRRAPARTRVGAYPWAMAGAVALLLRGQRLPSTVSCGGGPGIFPVLTTVVVVCLTLAVLRALRAQPSPCGG